MNQTLLQEYKCKVAQRAILGCFMKTGDPAFVEAAGYAGMDYIILDMEHGPTGLQAMQNNVRAAQVAGVLPIVRVNRLDEVSISQALDIGAAGVQVPQICSAQDAEKAVAAARFHPQGERGVCRFVRAAKYSNAGREAYFAAANEALVICQLEGTEAIDNLDEILAVPGIDVLFIGPYDLSQSLGLIGQTTHPAVVARATEIVQKAQEKNIVTGIFSDSEETMRMWKDAGVRYIAHSVDVGIFSQAVAGLVAQFGQL